MLMGKSVHVNDNIIHLENHTELVVAIIVQIGGKTVHC